MKRILVSYRDEPGQDAGQPLTGIIVAVYQGRAKWRTSPKAVFGRAEPVAIPDFVEHEPDVEERFPYTTAEERQSIIDRLRGKADRQNTPPAA